MTSQEKAKELYGVFENILHSHFGYGEAKNAAVKQCARAAVDQIMLENASNDVQYNVIYHEFTSMSLQEFYEQVKEEIEKL